MSDKFPMTPAGFAWMRKQLKKLKEVDRPANAKAIEIARGHGDLSENADYSAAKEEQGMIEAKIRDYEAKLSLAEVIDPARLSGDRVQFGATVTIEDSESGETSTYTIVGEHEADIKRGRISIGAPLARALIGKELGETANVQTPKGKREVEVTKVEWMNPHARFYIDAKDDAGKIVNWDFELASPNGLMRRGWNRNSMKQGDVVTVTGHRAKNNPLVGNASTVTLGDGKRLFAGSSIDNEPAQAPPAQQ